MGKTLKLLILFLFIFNLSFGAYEFREFDSNFKSASRSELIKYHNSLKGIYIKSIIRNDLELKINTLTRLIKSSKKLNLSSKAYEKELLTLQKMALKDKKISKSINIDKLIQKSKVDDKKRGTKQFKESVIGKKARILKVQSSLKGISLIFDRDVKDVDIKSFVLKGKNSYRYVYDIGAILTIKSTKLKAKNISKIRISQYNKKTVRVVFQTSKVLKLYYTKIDNSINIGYKGLRAKNSLKSSQKKTNSKFYVPQNYKRNSKIIVIDAGHGGKDGGAQGARGLSEKKIVLQTALRVGRELKARGFKVYYTRISDKYIQLRNRTKMANRKNADLFISIHANAAPKKSKYSSMYGIETFFLSPARSKRSKNVAALENKTDLVEMNYFSKQTYLNFLNREKILASNKLAIDIQQGMLNSLKKRYKVRDGGVREAPFWVLVGAQMPAVLVEIGYITNPIEGKRIATSTYQNLVANGIANGIVSYFDKNY